MAGGTSDEELQNQPELVPEHHTRRPMNAFLIFCKRHRSIVRKSYPNLENRSITKILGEWWADLEPLEKGTYIELARKYREAFLKANPDFKWYKLPAPPLRSSGASHKPIPHKMPKLTYHASCGPITLTKLADESQLGGLSNLIGSPPSTTGQSHSGNLKNPPSLETNSVPVLTQNCGPPKPPKKRYLEENYVDIGQKSNINTHRDKCDTSIVKREVLDDEPRVLNNSWNYDFKNKSNEFCGYNKNPYDAVPISGLRPCVDKYVESTNAYNCMNMSNYLYEPGINNNSWKMGKHVDIKPVILPCPVKEERNDVKPGIVHNEASEFSQDYDVVTDTLSSNSLLTKIKVEKEEGEWSEKVKEEVNSEDESMTPRLMTNFNEMLTTFTSPSLIEEFNLKNNNNNSLNVANNNHKTDQRNMMPNENLIKASQQQIIDRVVDRVCFKNDVTEKLISNVEHAQNQSFHDNNLNWNNKFNEICYEADDGNIENNSSNLDVNVVNNASRSSCTNSKCVSCTAVPEDLSIKVEKIDTFDQIDYGTKSDVHERNPVDNFASLCTNNTSANLTDASYNYSLENQSNNMLFDHNIKTVKYRCNDPVVISESESNFALEIKYKIDCDNNSCSNYENNSRGSFNGENCLMKNDSKEMVKNTFVEDSSIIEREKMIRDMIINNTVGEFGLNQGFKMEVDETNDVKPYVISSQNYIKSEIDNAYDTTVHSGDVNELKKIVDIKMEKDTQSMFQEKLSDNVFNIKMENIEENVVADNMKTDKQKLTRACKGVRYKQFMSTNQLGQRRYRKKERPKSKGTQTTMSNFPLPVVKTAIDVETGKVESSLPKGIASQDESVLPAKPVDNKLIKTEKPEQIEEVVGELNESKLVIKRENVSKRKQIPKSVAGNTSSDFNLDMMIEQLPPLSLEDFQLKKRAKKHRIHQSPVKSIITNDIQQPDDVKLISNHNSILSQPPGTATYNRTSSSEQLNKVNKNESLINNKMISTSLEKSKKVNEVLNSKPNKVASDSHTIFRMQSIKRKLSFEEIDKIETSLVKRESNLGGSDLSKINHTPSFPLESNLRTYLKRPRPLKNITAVESDDKVVKRSNKQDLTTGFNQNIIGNDSGTSDCINKAIPSSLAGQPPFREDMKTKSANKKAVRNICDKTEHLGIGHPEVTPKQGVNSPKTYNNNYKIFETVANQMKMTESSGRLNKTTASLVGSQKRKALKKNITHLEPGSKVKDTSVVEVKQRRPITGGLATLAQVAAIEKRLLD